MVQEIGGKIWPTDTHFYSKM